MKKNLLILLLAVVVHANVSYADNEEAITSGVKKCTLRWGFLPSTWE